MTVSVADVYAAAERIGGLVKRTPVVRADIDGRALFLKCENLQHSG